MGGGPTVEMCLAGREITEPRPSPNGSVIACISRVSGQPAQMVLVPVDGGPERVVATAVAPATGRGHNGGVFCWLPDGSAIVHVGVDGGLWLQPVPSGVARRLADVEGVIEGPVCTGDGTQVIVTVDRAAVWAMATTGEGRPRRLDDGRHDFCLDPVVDGAGDEARVIWQAWSVPDMPWDRSVMVEVPLSGGAPRVVEGRGQMQQFTPIGDGSIACLRDDTGWLNVWLDGSVLVDEPCEHGGPTWGPAQRSLCIAPDRSMIAFTRNEDGFGRLCVVDLRTSEVHEVARGVHGQLHWVPGSIVALRSGARTPTAVVAYATAGDPALWTRRTLAVGPVAGWEDANLPEPEVHRAIGTDGTSVPMRRYAAGQGRAMVQVHGGPTDQWQVEFLPRIAYWWSKGWDVIVPDPRGSTGHGRHFAQALRGGWGRDDVDDVRTAIRHVLESGWATSSTTVVMGSSSGGMAALGVAIGGAELVAGCIALYPVTEPADLAERSHRYEAHYALGLIGPEGDPAYDERSLLNRAEQIDVPVLLMHGTDDPVVPVEQSRSLAARMQSAGRTVRFEEFAAEGHGFRRVENRRSEFRLIGEFLDEVRRGATVVGSSLTP